ncbi:triacylglycerol lipase, partial [Phenoliferia sp. Uapishka_3]
MTTSSILLAPTLRRLVCLGATFSAAANPPNPLPILASPRARDTNSLDIVYVGAVGDLIGRGSHTSDSISVQKVASRVGAGAVVARRPHAPTRAGSRPRSQKTAEQSANFQVLPLELGFSLLSTFDTLFPSARSAGVTTAVADFNDLPRRPAFRDIVVRKLRYSRTSRNVGLSQISTSTLRISTCVRPRQAGARPLSTLRPSQASKSPALASHDQARSEPGTPPPYLDTKPLVSGGGALGTRGVATSGAHPTPNITDKTDTTTKDQPVIEKKEEDKNSTSRGSGPYVDEINTLLRHPTLYDPILAPRYPIVLCHGLYGFDVRGPTFFRLHYWGDLLKVLRGKIGAEVFVTSVPGTGAVKQRAHVLHEALEKTEGLLGRDLNFVAHSMGGLDARYLLTKIHPTAYNPRSLTTISTPHRGSEFMSWCRVNIGIGTDFDKTSEEAARLLHEDNSITLPYSLKAPILSRAQVEAARQAADAAKKAKDAADQVKANFPGLPYSLSTSVSGYLLDLLDSPAYANLTPGFLRDVFNPQTPDRPDIKYYSVAARTEKIGIWHPLWLPKVVLDGAEAAREANGIYVDPRWKGNDGLVNVESAKWGEFLGVLENCDHWAVRGSSGLVNAVASAKAVAEATNISSNEEVDVVRQASKIEKSGGWKWQDVYRLVGIKSNESNSEDQKPTLAVVEQSPAPKSGKEDDASSLAALASWIVHTLPGIPDPSNSPSPTSTTLTNSPPTDRLPPAVSSNPPESKSGPMTGSPNPRSSASGPSSSGLQAARMMYGAPKSTSQPEKFNLERMALALCRKLHNEGL